MAPIDSKTLETASGDDGDSSFWELIRSRLDGPEVALAYAHVFWPDLIEVEGFVLIKENYDPEYLSRVVADCSRESVEATINTTYMQDLFEVGAVEPERAIWTRLGELVRDSWKSRAQAQFPDREFVATFAWYSEDGDPGVTLFQETLPPAERKPNHSKRTA